MKQSGQVGKVGTTLGEIQATQHTLATVMEKIQNHLMQDSDTDEAPSVDETPAISESIPPQAGPSGEMLGPTILSRASFEANVEKQLQRIKEIQLKGILEEGGFTPIPLVTTLTEPIILRA